MDYKLVSRAIKNKLDIKQQHDSDFFADKLFHRYTTRIVIFLIGVSVLKQFYHAPINCWVPKEIKRYENFISHYCWLKGTYYVDQSYDAEDTFSFSSNNQNLIRYYQWVTVFLAFQAFLFYLPRVIWEFLTYKIVDIDLSSLVYAARKYECSAYDRKHILKYLLSHLSWAKKAAVMAKLNELIRKHKPKGKTFRNLNIYASYDNIAYLKLKLSKSVLSLVYIWLKFFALIIIATQITITNRFLVNDSQEFYGDLVYRKFFSGQAELTNGSESSSSSSFASFFPLITVCDVNIKEVDAQSTNHLYNFSCILPLNLFNQKIFMLLWFWMMFVLLPIAFFDFTVWVKRFVYRSAFCKYKFIRTRLTPFMASGPLGEHEKSLMRVFSDYYVDMDDYFILRLLEANSNLILTSDLINELWLNFNANLSTNG
jgi:hypothetical protein